MIFLSLILNLIHIFIFDINFIAAVNIGIPECWMVLQLNSTKQKIMWLSSNYGESITRVAKNWLDC